MIFKLFWPLVHIAANCIPFVLVLYQFIREVLLDPPVECHADVGHHSTLHCLSPSLGDYTYIVSLRLFKMVSLTSRLPVLKKYGKENAQINAKSKRNIFRYGLLN